MAEAEQPLLIHNRKCELKRDMIMVFIEQLKAFFGGSLFQVIVNMSGMICGIIAIIQEIKPPKRIRYKISRKANKILICFWNASKITIKKDDVFHFYLLGNNRIRGSKIYQTNADIPIICKNCGEVDEIDWHLDESTCTLIRNGRMKLLGFKFEFLPSKSGAIFLIENESSDDVSFGIKVFGRMRGEKSDSIAPTVRSNYKDEPWKSTVVLTRAYYFLAILLILQWVPNLIIEISQNPMNMPVWLAIIGYAMLCLGKIRQMIIDSMPIHLWTEYRKKCKEDGFEPSYKKYDYDR